MSWAHFLAMAFLILFFLGALIVLYVRNKRTKEILTTLLQEQKDESKG
jgi:thiosulfate reductase cytochrome b subunit